MRCNIDQRGRAIRMIAGGILESAGFVILALNFTGVLGAPGQTWGYWVGGALALSGLFVLMEGALGWCAVRACGVRTPI